MGGQSVPAATSTDQRIVTGWMADPGLRKRALGVIDPALSSIHDQQQMLLGFQKSDPNQTRKLFGLSPQAPLSEISKAIAMKSRGPDIQMPQVPAAQQGPQPRAAASGGIMSLGDDEPKDPRKFAKGGDSTPKDLSPAQNRQLANLQQRQEANKLTPAQRNQLNRLTQQRETYQTYQKDKSGVSDAARQAGLTPADAYLGQAGFFGGALTVDPVTGQQVFSVTNPYYNQAVNVLQGMNQQPAAFTQAGEAYQSALAGLKGAGSYAPSSVGGVGVNRGDIRDINAIMADVEKYKAAGMEPPPDLQAEAYQAAQIQGASMEGPASWTQAGTAEQYMSPYVKNVLEQQQQLANRQFAQQQAQRASQAAQQKAFGGSRAALQAQEAQYQQNLANQSMVQQGLAGAYGQGMQQFQAESGLSQQAKQANLAAAMQTQQQNQAAVNQQRSQYVAQALQAAQTNYGGRLTAAQQNQVAQNAAAQFNAQSQNLAFNNYVQQQLAAQQSNQQMDWNTAQLNAQLAQQAQIANQSAGLQANQQNIGAFGQMAGIGQGLGSLGTQIGNYGSNLANLWGQAGSTLQGLGQNYFNQIQQNAGGIYGGPTTLAGQGANLLSGAGGQSGNVNRQNTPGSAFG